MFRAAHPKMRPISLSSIPNLGSPASSFIPAVLESRLGFSSPADSESGGSSGSSSGSGLSPSLDPGPSGGNGSSPLVPFSGTVTATDGAGNSVSETVTSGPTDDGGFSLTVTLSDTYGNSASATPDDNNGTSSLTITFVVTPTSAVATLLEDDSDTFKDSETLTGPSGGGSWSSSGTSHFHEDETVTVMPDGTASVVDAEKSNATDKYKLSLTKTTANGLTFTDDDSGTDQTSSDDSQSLDTQGGDTESNHDEVHSTETTTEGESGGGLTESGTSTEAVDFIDDESVKLGQYNETQSTTDDSNDSANYHNAGPTGDGGSFDVTDGQKDKYNDSDVITYGTGINTTDHETQQGSNNDIFSLTLSNVPDDSGSGSGSGSGDGGTTDNITVSNSFDGTNHEDDTTTTDANGAVTASDEDDSTATTSASDSGSDPAGPFSESHSGTVTDEVTGIVDASGYHETGETTTSTPPNGTSSGTLPSSPTFSTDIRNITESAYQFNFEDVAAVVASLLTSTQAAAPPAPVDPPTEQRVKDTIDFKNALAALQKNADFSRLFAGCGGNINYLPIPGVGDGKKVYLLGMTTPNGRRGAGRQDVRIFRNSLEFKVLRATDPANYSRLL